MKIGITGGMGSGKSYIVSIFETLGAVVYHADQVAKELVYRPDVKSQIIEEFGAQAFENDIYQTAYIAPIVFENPKRLKKLNSIIHPAVLEDFQKFASSNLQAIIAYESALIIEAGHSHLFDLILLVTAPEEIRIQRIKNRDNLTEDQIKNRMKNQWSDEEKIPYADYIIENIDREASKNAVQKIWNDLNAHDLGT